MPYDDYISIWILIPLVLGLGWAEYRYWAQRRHEEKVRQLRARVLWGLGDAASSDSHR